MTADATTTPQASEKKTEEKVDVRNLQDKFHGLLDQRNHYNDLAREAREARDLLNQQRRDKAEEIDTHKAAREAANEKMRAHREIRNGYEDQAKALIAQKKGKTGAIERSLPLKVRKLRNDIEAAMERQETTVLGPAKEKELVESIRDMRRELAELESQLDKQKATEVDLDDTDKAIDQLFAKADEEHVHVVAHQKHGNEHHKKFVEAVKEIRILADESDKKHQEFIAIRKKADECHQKAMELREKVMAVRGERRAEFAARRKEIGDVNQRAFQAVNDPKAIEKAQESALDLLKKGGKITLG